MRRQTLVGFVLGLGGCLGEVLHGDGVEATEARSVGAFEEVVATASFDVAVSIGPPAVEVTCDEDLLTFITTEVEGDTLLVGAGDAQGDWVILAPRAPCHVRVSTPALVGVGSTGSGRLIVTGDPAPLADVHSSGSGGLIVEAEVTSEALSITATGSGDVTFGVGTLTALEVLLTGSGALVAPDLVAADADATLSGSGDAEITATETLDATLTGSGDLTVHGDPATRDVTETGSGVVRFR